MKNMNFAWSNSNSKLKKENIVSFNIPALQAADGFTTCPQAGLCASLCYARQGRYQMANVRAPRERNIAKLREMTATDKNWGWIDVQLELENDVSEWRRKGKRIICIHDSGDFYSREYFYTWLAVAEHFPDMTFYAYTKQISMYQQALVNRHVPINFYITQSCGGKEDHLIDVKLPHTRIFPRLIDLVVAGYVDGTHTDKWVYEGARCVGLVYHGNKKLTSAQANTLLDIEVNA